MECISPNQTPNQSNIPNTTNQIHHKLYISDPYNESQILKKETIHLNSYNESQILLKKKRNDKYPRRRGHCRPPPPPSHPPPAAIPSACRCHPLRSTATTGSGREEREAAARAFPAQWLSRPPSHRHSRPAAAADPDSERGEDLTGRGRRGEGEEGDRRSGSEECRSDRDERGR